MRLALVFLSAALVSVGAASAQPAGNAPSLLPAAGIERMEKLADLFETLRTTPDERTARRTEDSIFAIWMDSGSPTINLLMSRTMSAMDTEDYPLALDLLDRVTSLAPDYAEAWNKRATVHFLVDDYGRAIGDLERVLALEPRHFGALAGLGQILREVGDDLRALDAFRAALAIDPHMEKIGGIIEEIEKDSGGRDI